MCARVRVRVHARSNFLSNNLYSICQNPDPITEDLAYGGASGFFYTCGLAFYKDEGEISDLAVQFHIKGPEEISTSYLEIPQIYEICTSKPEQCFTNLSLRYQGERYSAVNYSIFPYNMNVKDPGATYNYRFAKEQYLLKCFENRIVLPVEFEFDGYIYTNDLSDSLKISNFNSSFLLFGIY